MKLELKHWSAYLPYGLNTKYDLHDVVGGGHIFRDKLLTTDNIQFVLDYCKPILRPLSDLTKEIEVGGKRFVPIVELAKIENGWDDSCSILRYYFNEGITVKSFYVVDYISDELEWRFGIKQDMTMFLFCNDNIHTFNQFKLFEKLFEWHFNVFNLPEDLWIDINKLPEY